MRVGDRVYRHARPSEGRTIQGGPWLQRLECAALGGRCRLPLHSSELARRNRAFWDWGSGMTAVVRWVWAWVIGVTVWAAVGLCGASSALAATRVLNPVGSPVATGLGPDSVAFSPSGRLLAVVNWTSDSVSMFAVRSTGTLAPVPGSPYAVATVHDGVPSMLQPGWVTFSPSGRLLAVDRVYDYEDSFVEMFSVSPTGSLTHVSSPPVQTNDGWPLAFSPSGSLLAVGGISLEVFSVNSATGALTLVASSPPNPTGGSSLAFSPSGGLLAVGGTGGDVSGSISVFSVSSTGALGKLFVRSVDFAGLDSLAFSPSGGLLAVSGISDAPGFLQVFSVNSSTGVLRLRTVVSSYAIAGSLAFSPSGRLLAATGLPHHPSVVLYSVNSAGALRQVPGSLGATGPFASSLAFSPSGKLLAVATPGCNIFRSACPNGHHGTVSMFSISRAASSKAVRR